MARGEDPFKLDSFRIVVNYMPVNKAVQMMTYPGMTIDQALRIIGRHSYIILGDLLMVVTSLLLPSGDGFSPAYFRAVKLQTRLCRWGSLTPNNGMTSISI